MELDSPQARTIEVPLSFLGGGTYRALMARDKADDPAAAVMEERAATARDRLGIVLRPGAASWAASRCEPRTARPLDRAVRA